MLQEHRTRPFQKPLVVLFETRSIRHAHLSYEVFLRWRPGLRGKLPHALALESGHGAKALEPPSSRTPRARAACGFGSHHLQRHEQMAKSSRWCDCNRRGMPAECVCMRCRLVWDDVQAIGKRTLLQSCWAGTRHRPPVTLSCVSAAEGQAANWRGAQSQLDPA